MPDRMWSYDESGFCGANPIVNQRVVAPSHRRGDQPRLADASVDYRKHWTVGVCVNGAGSHIPPAWILQSKGVMGLEKMKDILEGAPPGSVLWNNGASVDPPFRALHS